MSQVTRTILLSAAAGLVSSLALAADTPPYVSPEMKALGLDLEKPLLIPTLKSVSMAPFSTAMDGRISVRVSGSTPTQDWSDPHLLLIDTKDTSADAFIDVAFLVVPANGETGFADASYYAERVFLKEDQGTTKGVRVWGENGCIELKWSGENESTVVPFAECVKKAGLVPVP